MNKTNDLKSIAQLLRRDAINMTTVAGSGHPTSCMSCAEIISVLFFNEMSYDPKNHANQNNDEFVLSKGHAAPILYAALARAGCIHEDILKLRKLDSPLEGHPMPASLPWIRVATGSLGQGISAAVGMAIAARLQKNSYRTYCVLGDSEVAEGSVVEAIAAAVHYQLSNLCIIIDINRLGQSGETMYGHNISRYQRIYEAYGAAVISIDGHNVDELIRAFDQARKNKTVTVILAKTLKGKGVLSIENKEEWHGKPIPKEMLEKVLQEIPETPMPKVTPKFPEARVNEKGKSIKKISIKILPSYKLGEKIATREAYGMVLAKIAEQDSSVVATDAEVKNSTFSIKVLQTRPAQFVEAYIAEQNMIGMALGMSVKGCKVFGSTFAAFLTRAHDQIRMAALSSANFTIVGSHAGVSIGEDGPSQMALEDLSMFRALPGSIVLYPSDAVATEKMVELALTHPGIKYIRTSRPKTPVIYDNSESFPIGEFKVVKASGKDKAIIVAAGVTLFEALKAYENLKAKGIDIAVVDAYCLKPFDGDKFSAIALKSGGKVIVVEDHYPEGGLGETITSALACKNIEVEHLAVRSLPHSATPEELLRLEEIDAVAIEHAVKRLI